MQSSADISNKEFVMKDSRPIHFIFFIACFIFSGVSLYNLIENESVHNSHSAKNFLLSIQIFCSIFGTISLLNGLKQKIILVINGTGIYSMGELKTNWEDFINARTFEMQTSEGYSIYKIFIQYYNADKIYESEITILDSYDSSAEEVIDAIKRFNKYPVVES